MDVLERGHLLERRDDHWTVRSPANPGFWWGNFLLFDDAPRTGDGERWEALFDAEFGEDPRILHRTFAWDRTDGDRGQAERELLTRGYAIEETTGLCMRPGELRRHPRENGEVTVRTLDPHGDPLWDQVAAVQLDDRQQQPGQFHQDIERTRAFIDGRLRALRELFAAGRGAWYVALDGDAVVGSLAVVVTEGRARYQHVDTLGSHRRRGIASRLVADAAVDVAARFPVEDLVIAADPGYHAVRLYEDLGFRALERVCGALLGPGAR